VSASARDRGDIRCDDGCALTSSVWVVGHIFGLPGPFLLTCCPILLSRAEKLESSGFAVIEGYCGEESRPLFEAAVEERVTLNAAWVKVTLRADRVQLSH
jgi:hypothetical protein